MDELVELALENESVLGTLLVVAAVIVVVALLLGIGPSQVLSWLV